MKTIRETSDFVANKLIEKAGITDGDVILEPSCGNGKLIKTILEKYTFKNLTIFGTELNKELAQEAQKLTSVDNKICVIHLDFFNFHNEAIKFNKIIAAPPFKNNSDVLHIERMYSMLAKNGIIVSLTTPYWLTNNESHQVEFRKFLQDKEYYLTMLPDNTFKEKDKGVPTAIIKLYKK